MDYNFDGTECDICANNICIFFTIACNHIMCKDCMITISRTTSLCPFCRKEFKIDSYKKKSYDAINKIILNYDTSSTTDLTKALNLSCGVFPIIDGLCEKLSKNPVPKHLSKVLLMLDLVRNATNVEQMRMSYFYSNENMRVINSSENRDGIAFRGIPSMEFLLPLKYSLPENKTINEFMTNKMTINGTYGTNINYNNLDPIETMIELEDGMKLNLIQFYYYKYERIVTKHRLHKGIKIQICKCIISLIYCMNNDDKDAHTQFYIQDYDEKEIRECMNKVKWYVKDKNGCY